MTAHRLTMGAASFTLDVRATGRTVCVNAPEPDPAWQLVDAAGHGHFWRDDRPGPPPARGSATGGEANYPTLKWVSGPCHLDHGDDCDAEGHWECPECGEWIVPGTRYVGDIYVPGTNEYSLVYRAGGTITTYQFGQRQWDQLTERFSRAITEVLAGYEVNVEIRGG